MTADILELALPQGGGSILGWSSGHREALEALPEREGKEREGGARWSDTNRLGIPVKLAAESKRYPESPAPAPASRATRLVLETRFYPDPPLYGVIWTPLGKRRIERLSGLSRF